MVLKGLNISKDEAIMNLEGICKIDGIAIKINKSNKGIDTQLKLDEDGLLRIYETSKGLTIDGSSGKNKEKNNLVLSKFKEMDLKKVENIPTKFNVHNKSDRSLIKDEIISYSENNNINLSHKMSIPNAEYAFILTSNRTREKVTVIQYNTGTLTVQGINWILWGEICYIIDKVLEPNISEIISRMTGIDEDVTYSKEENTIRKILSDDVTNFMNKFDLDYIISGLCCINAKIKCPDYTHIYNTALRSSEGFLKKILLDLKIKNYEEITSRNFKFSCVFNSKRELKKEYKEFIKDSNKVKGLEKIYDIIKLRNNNFHSGIIEPPSIICIEECERKFNLCLQNLKEGYNLIYN